MNEGTKVTETLEVWSCNACAFTMDARHTEEKTEKDYACPACNELALQVHVVELEKELADKAEYVSRATFSKLQEEHQASQQQVKVLRDTLPKLFEYASHDRGADLPMSQSIPECEFWSDFHRCSCGYTKAREAIDTALVSTPAAEETSND